MELFFPIYITSAILFIQAPFIYFSIVKLRKINEVNKKNEQLIKSIFSFTFCFLMPYLFIFSILTGSISGSIFFDYAVIPFIILTIISSFVVIIFSLIPLKNILFYFHSLFTMTINIKDGINRNISCKFIIPLILVSFLLNFTLSLLVISVASSINLMLMDNKLHRIERIVLDTSCGKGGCTLTVNKFFRNNGIRIDAKSFEINKYTKGDKIIIQSYKGYLGYAIIHDVIKQ